MADAVKRSNSVRSIHVTEEKGVQQDVYLKWIDSQLQNENSCLELPTTILLLITFSLLSYWHLDQQSVFAVEQGIEQDIIENSNFAFSHYFGHKGIHDVHSFADYWSWTRLGFMPLVVQPTWGYSEEYATDALAAARLTDASAVAISPESSWSFVGNGPNAKSIPIRGDYLHYNRLVGGIRFRQQVAPSSEGLCTFPGTASAEQWQRWYGKPCMPAWEELVFPPTSAEAENFVQPEREEWFLLDVDSFDTMIAKLVDMEDGCAQLPSKNRTKCLCEWCQKQNPPSPWVTEDTQRIEIGFASFNPNYGLITQTGVNFFFNRGGLISKRVEIMSTFMDIFAWPLWELVPMLVVDGIWVLLLLQLFINESKEIWNAFRASGNQVRGIYEDYVRFWNVVDWISFSVAVVVIAFFIDLQLQTRSMHVHFEALASAQELSTPDRNVVFKLTTAFFEALQMSIDSEKRFRLILCFYPMVVMVRLFKSFAAQPRLAVVTETLVAGALDMGHFFIIFCSVLCCLCLDGILLFGQDVKAFASFQRSLHTCFRMMFGDWDWAPIENVRRGHAAFWFVLYIFMVVVILLNMLLAIIMESYMVVKKNASGAITLPRQIQEMWRRHRDFRKGKRVRLNDIYDIFLKEARAARICEKDMKASKRIVTCSYLVDHGVPKTQALRTMKNAMDEETARHSTPFELEHAEDIIRNLNKSTASTRDDLFFLYELTQFWDNTNKAAEMQVEGLEDEPIEMPAPKTSDDQDLNHFLGFVTGELERLSGESANVLAQTMKETEDRQSSIELRQADMLLSVNEMQGKLQNLQNRAYMVLMQLQRNKFDSTQSHWRRQEGTVMPACLDCVPGGVEAPIPKISG